MDAWYNRFLSQADKEILLKSVVTALPTYTMSCFMLPKGLLKDINVSMKNFWWNSIKDKHKIPWIAWNKITDIKQEGGIGIRDLEAFNIALLAKQDWRIMRDPTSLIARVFKAKYFRKTSFLAASAYRTSSYAWRSIIKAQDLLKKGTKWAVGSGQQIKLWEDNWLPTTPSRPPQGPGAVSQPDMLVKDLLLPGTMIWNVEKLIELINPLDVEIIKQIRPSITKGKDILIWKYAKNGTYSVKTGYKMVKTLMHEDESRNIQRKITPLEVKEVAKQVWNFHIPPKMKIFWWRIAHNGISVSENLIRRNIHVDPTCQLCGEYVETTNHMLFQCRVAREIWNLAPTGIVEEEDIRQSSLMQNIGKIFTRAKQGEDLLLFLGWRIWKMRNALMFNNKREHITHVIQMALMDQKAWNEAQQEIHNEQ